MTRDAVLLMAYGSPDRLEDVEAYYTDIRRGSTPPRELLEDLLRRYLSIGGSSPLSGIVERQRAALATELAARGRGIPVYAGMRHIAPRIATVVERAVADGVERVVAIALAPQRSSNGLGYRKAVAAGIDAAVAAGHARPEVVVVESWHDEPRFIDAVAENVAAAIARFEDPSTVRVMFTAHSLPERVVAEGDRYPEEIAATAALVAVRLGLTKYDRAFQSAGRTGEAWLGPDLRDELRRLAAEGVQDVVVAPVGFVADHLEVLYDIDIEARATAAAHGMRLERPVSMNDNPEFIAALADIATAGLDGTSRSSIELRPAAPVEA